MKFRHKTIPNAIVRLGYRPVRFVDGELETTDKDVQEILLRSPNVERVDKPRKRRSKEKE